MIFRVELRDKEFNILEILDAEFMNLRWAYSRLGGCGEFSFDLARDYCNEKSISGDFNIRINYRNPSTKNYDLWYQGLVEDKYPAISGDEEIIRIDGHGYSTQLSRIYVSKTYTSQEISVIVKDILDTFVVPNTDITYSASDIVATSFTPDSLKFNTDAKSALETCANIVGSREWGVDKDRKFSFKGRSSTVGFRYLIGKDITDFNEDQSFKDIVNRVIIQGGDVSGTPYTKTFNDTLSQAKYNLRTKVIQNSAITTDAVAQQYANSIFAEFNDVVRSAKCTFINLDQRIEETIPVPLTIIVGKPVRYSEKKYGTFLYSGLIERQLNKVNYILDNNNILKTRIDLGYLRPSIAENIAQLEYQLEQQRAGSL